MILSIKQRIVILETRAGKSSLASTIFGEELFEVSHGGSITLNISGFFDINKPEDDLRSEIERCISECAPGLHAFLILPKQGIHTEHEQNVISKIEECFSEEVFNCAIAVFTHGDQLGEGQTLEDFVSLDQSLSELVRKRGGRCHVMDSKYWQDKPKDEYRNNQFQVEEILKSIDKMIKANNDGRYTNEMLPAILYWRVRRRIEKSISWLLNRS
ncbi:GTPase IMAP family member 7-like [Cheilinus undulatus]|uniref:GTPase IMAP family member 7-like n=1 Tax=Cheilinus undulatus TaxID=241271 RepID=UPI001BD28DB1|nr:GTPase IMAP family member 7-like [Cheilinus undulatus]